MVKLGFNMVICEGSCWDSEQDLCIAVLLGRRGGMFCIATRSFDLVAHLMQSTRMQMQCRVKREAVGVSGSVYINAASTTLLNAR